MAVFSRELSERSGLDWQLFQNGAVALYLGPNILSEDLRWLSNHNYAIYEFDCEQWTSEISMHDSFKRVLTFPDYYGRNFDALEDCLSDLSIQENGGAVLVFRCFDDYAKKAGASLAHSNRTHAHVILDICARVSRLFLLTGQRLLLMIHSKDPRIEFNELGSVNAQWNPREWLNKNRGL